MAKAKLLNQKGESSKDVTLNDAVWAIEPNDIVLKKALDLYLASLRQGTHKTKGVGEVSGSNKKPWRQKGTGRARVGQKRNPIWTGGGHAFALTNRNYGFKMNKKERTLALKSALTYKNTGKKLMVVDNLELSDLKTKSAKTLLDNLKLEGKTLFVTVEDCENLYMATRNLGYTLHLLADEINVYDIVNADNLVIDEKALTQIEEVLK